MVSEIMNEIRKEVIEELSGYIGNLTNLHKLNIWVEHARKYSRKARQKGDMVTVNTVALMLKEIDDYVGKSGIQEFLKNDEEKERMEEAGRSDTGCNQDGREVV